MSSCASYVSHTHDVIDDVTRSPSKSNFEIDISPSIFELQRRSKAQNVENAHGYLFGIFDIRYEKIVPNYAKKVFHDDDVIDGVTGWPQSRPFIFLYKWNNNVFHDNLKTSRDIIIKLPVQFESKKKNKWNNNFFHDNLKTSKDIIIKLPVHRYHELMTTIV